MRIHGRLWANLGPNSGLVAECSEHGGSCWTTKCPLCAIVIGLKILKYDVSILDWYLLSPYQEFGALFQKTCKVRPYVFVAEYKIHQLPCHLQHFYSFVSRGSLKTHISSRYDRSCSSETCLGSGHPVSKTINTTCPCASHHWIFVSWRSWEGDGCELFPGYMSRLFLVCTISRFEAFRSRSEISWCSDPVHWVLKFATWMAMCSLRLVCRPKSAHASSPLCWGIKPLLLRPLLLVSSLFSSDGYSKKGDRWD